MREMFSVIGHRDHRIVNLQRRETQMLNPTFAVVFSLEIHTNFSTREGDQAERAVLLN